MTDTPTPDAPIPLPDAQPSPNGAPPPRCARRLASPPIRPQRHLCPLHHCVLHRGRASGQLIRLAFEYAFSQFGLVDERAFLADLSSSA